jgi:hypothetical protein
MNMPDLTVVSFLFSDGKQRQKLKAPAVSSDTLAMFIPSSE